MGNARGSLHIGLDEDEEGEEDGGEHLSQALEMSGIPISDEDSERGGTANNDYAAHAELVSVCTLGERPNITASTPYVVIQSAVLIKNILTSLGFQHPSLIRTRDVNYPQMIASLSYPAVASSPVRIASWSQTDGIYYIIICILYRLNM